MHDDVTKALWDSYAAEDKNDFFPIYHYLKHIQAHVFRHAAVWPAPMEPKEKPDEDVDQMIKHPVLHIAETSMSLDTSIYMRSGKIQGCGQAVTHKDDLHLLPQRP